MPDDAERRIEALENQLRIVRTQLAAEKAKRLDERLKDLSEELAETKDRHERMRQHVIDAAAMIDRWIDAFDLQVTEEGKYKPAAPHIIDSYDALVKDYNDLLKQFEDLREKWNAHVPIWNAEIAPKRKRAVGRPLAASEAQCRKVLRLRAEGKSIRFIADEMNLGMQTVRTIIDRKDYADRATLKHLDKIDHKPIRDKLAKGRKRTREALLKTGIAEMVKTGEQLHKEAKGL
jgi:hypothetical protein